MVQLKNQKAYDYAQSVQPQVHRLCKPLFEATPVHMFAYYQQRSSGRFLLLSSDAQWLKRSFSNECWLKSFWLQCDLSQASQQGFHCRVWRSKYKGFTGLYTLNLYRQTDTHIKHMWIFISYIQNVDLSLYYARHSDVFKLFASRMMQLGYRIMHPDEKYYAFLDNSMLTPNKAANPLLHTVLHETPLKRFPMMIDGEECWITYGEAMCLQGLSKGQTAKMIARQMGLSHRTIEKHVENLKKKLSVRSRAELIYLFNQSRDAWV